MSSFTTNGVKIAFQEVGSGEPLLLLMGLGAPGSVWERHVDAYARHFRCILMDNRGAGDSDKPQGPYFLPTMADEAAALLDHLGITSARVAGISMGSGIAQELAIRHSAKVQSLVLVSSWARCDTYTKEIFLHFARARALLPPGDFIRMLQLWIYAPDAFHTGWPELESARNEAASGPAMPQHAFEAQCSACIDHDTLARLGAIRQPCLLTVGELDIFTPPRFSSEMASQIPNAQLGVFKGLGHCHHWENLAAFNAMTTQFLLEH